MMSSINHDDFDHLKVPLENILIATNNFGNYVGANEFVNYFKGLLLFSGELIFILAQKLNKEWFDGERQFWLEVSILSSLKHKNLISFVGFCYDNDEKVIIYKRETRKSLYNHLRHSMSLTWVRRLEISVGIAQALSYIHYDESRDFSVIHRNINSGSVYLNDEWEPKLGDFVGSMKIKASERHRSFNTDKVWMSKDGYTDPSYIETKMVNHKSDIYSFGIVLFELICGRKSVIANDTNKYLAPMAITHYREKKLHEIIDWDLWQQMDSQSFNILAETAYECLNEERSKRPNINEIVSKLEKALKLAYENRLPVVRVGAWGGSGGIGEWTYLVPNDARLEQIQVITNGHCIYSIQFMCFNQYNRLVNSDLYGGDANLDDGITYIVEIPNGRHLSAISGTFGTYQDLSNVITSLSFRVGRNIMGPFGGVTGTTFSLPVNRGVIKGFFGNSGDYLDSLGVVIDPL